MLILIIRTIILYFFSVLIIRLMGKRQIGELQPHELVMTFMISDLASLSMQDMRFPLLLAILPMATLLVTKVILTEIELRSSFVRKLMDGKPDVIIRNGEIVPEVMKRQKLNIYDILEEVREKGILDLNEIEYAILENNGDISIFTKDEFSLVQKKDLDIKSDEKNLPYILVFDGKVQKDSLKSLKKDVHWLMLELKKKDISTINNLYLVILTSKNELYIQNKLPKNGD
ncbi:DUF421 domain-containing protein [Clostridium sp.]|uniref:DUF421 domain-containing protein n=1 Tax=Clostridium sp. TaxID=1506 RepID=UPI0039922227